MEYVANKTCVFISKTERGSNQEVVLRAGQLYTLDRKLPDGELNRDGLRVLKDLLVAGAVRLVDTRPIDEAELR